MRTAVAEVVNETEVATIENKAANEANELARDVAAFVIASPEDADTLASIRGEIQARQKAVEDWFREPVEAAHKAHKALTTRRAEALAKFSEPLRIANQKLAAWNQEQARLRREAEEAAERERQRLMDEERIRKATEAEAAGDDHLAERIVSGSTPVAVPHVPVAAPAPRKVAGVSFVRKFRAEVVDVHALVRAVAAKPEWMSLLTVNTTALNKMVSALGDALVIPGVRVVEEQQVRSAAGRAR